jgi:hypothetical protein
MKLIKIGVGLARTIQVAPYQMIKPSIYLEAELAKHEDVVEARKYLESMGSDQLDAVEHNEVIRWKKKNKA